MAELLIGAVVGAAGMIIVFLIFRSGRGNWQSAPTIEMRSSVESIRAVGELVVLKVFTQQIVTKTEHLLGNWGEKWMAWMLSSKKTAMIFDFVVDFRYDLRSARFQTRIVGEDQVEFTMPPCFYEIQMKDLKIYDERASALVPLLLPEWIGQIFGGKFSEKEKNELIRAARQEAEGLAQKLADRMIGEVQHSAEATLRSIALGTGFSSARFKFSSEKPVQGEVDLSEIEQSADKAVVQAGR